MKLRRPQKICSRLRCERLEVRRVLDASALALWDPAPVEASSQSLTLDEGFTATAAAQFGDFTYTAANGAVTITGYTGAGGAISIPAEINGEPVRGIGANAFSNKTGLTGISIPASVTSLGSGAFYNCTRLTSMAVPASVTRDRKSVV